MVFNGKYPEYHNHRSALGFVDLRGFTEASESCPYSSFELVNTFFNMSKAVYSAGGEILNLWEMLFSLSFRGVSAKTCDKAWGGQILKKPSTVETKLQKFIRFILDAIALWKGHVRQCGNGCGLISL